MSPPSSGNPQWLYSMLLGIVGLVSALACIIMLGMLYRRGLARKKVKFLLLLTLWDLLQGIGASLSFYWIFHSMDSRDGMCTVQGHMMPLSFIGSAAIVTSIGVYTLLVSWGIVAGYPNSRILKYFPVFSGVISLLCALLFGVILPLTKSDYIGPVIGAFCAISDNHWTEKVTFHYVFILMVQIILIIIYSILAFQRHNDTKYKGIMGFPIIFLLLTGGVTIERLLSAIFFRDQLAQFGLLWNHFYLDFT
jgi:intracellular septation protein A